MSEVKTLHEPFADFLRKAGILFIRARSDEPSTIEPGHPDFTLVMASRCLLIEFKTKEGVLSRAQKDRIALLESTGTRVHVLRDLAAAIELVTAWRGTLGQIRDVSPAGDLPKRDANLRRFGAMIVRPGAGGSMERVRVATEADAWIPSL